MGYKTTRHVSFDGKDYPPGKAISFGEGDAAACEQLLALVPPAIEGDATKPLEKLPKAELAAIGEEEGVTFPDGATQAQMVEAIKAGRAEPAAG